MGAKEVKEPARRSSVKAPIIALSSNITTKVGMHLMTRRLQGQRLSLRDRLYLFANEPHSSGYARVFSWFMWLHVVIYCFSAMMETVEFLTSRANTLLWVALRFYLSGVFTFELVLRCISFSPLRKALAEPFVWLDIVCIVPFWVRVFMYPTSVTSAGYLLRHNRPLVIRTLESVAMFRLLKLSKNYSGAELLAKAIVRSTNELLVPLFMLAIMTVSFSSIMYDIEWDQTSYDCAELWKAHGVDRTFLLANRGGADWSCDVCEPSTLVALPAADAAIATQRCLTCNGFPPGHPECAGVPLAQNFPDIPRAMWFMFVTVTTVGYGDVTPDTWQGKLFGAFVILCGVIFLAMPITSVGNHFSRVWDERQMFLLTSGMRQQLMKQGISPDDVTSAFEQVDMDGDGNIDSKEFSSFVQDELQLKVTRGEMHELWKHLDIDGMGSIDFKEFTATLFPHMVSQTQDMNPIVETQQPKDFTESFIKQADKQADKISSALSMQLDKIQETVDARFGAMESRVAGVETQVAMIASAVQTLVERGGKKSRRRKQEYSVETPNGVEFTREGKRSRSPRSEVRHSRQSPSNEAKLRHSPTDEAKRSRTPTNAGQHSHPASADRRRSHSSASEGKRSSPSEGKRSSPTANGGRSSPTKAFTQLPPEGQSGVVTAIPAQAPTATAPARRESSPFAEYDGYDA